jgi:hypothetical protein
MTDEELKRRFAEMNEAIDDLFLLHGQTSPRIRKLHMTAGQDLHEIDHGLMIVKERNQ